MLKTFYMIVFRDMVLAMRRRTEVLTALFFFIIVISLFPLGVGVEKATLRLIAPGVVWIAALLASMLALERLFEGDYADGSLEQMLLTPQPVFILVLGKVFAHWLLTGIPLVLISPLVALQYYMPESSIGPMMLALLIGTPILSLIGAIGAALTLGLRGGGILISLLVLPLYIPVLIYGAGAVAASTVEGAPAQAYFMLLSAFLVLALIFSPWASSAALRISVE
ncbi:MAG: heme exporter protein CcmB [Gammaproteobacteria bacterium]|nr:MAG: heme exporter protein CcmB [Gammaproteobacteria bacterium]